MTRRTGADRFRRRSINTFHIAGCGRNRRTASAGRTAGGRHRADGELDRRRRRRGGDPDASAAADAELGLDARWDVLDGGAGFLRGDQGISQRAAWRHLPRSVRAISRSSCDYNRRNRTLLRLDADFIVIHDPQPAALIDARTENDGAALDLALPHRSVAARSGRLEFSRSRSCRATTDRFSLRPQFSRQLPIPQYLFYPVHRSARGQKSRARAGIGRIALSTASESTPERPILTQISRFDRLKDPVGVVRAYRIVKRYFDCQLVLAGGGASDDPEGSRCCRRRARRRVTIRTFTSLGAAAGGSARSQRSAAGVHHRDPEKPARGLRPHGRRSAVEEEAGGGVRRGRHSVAGDPQADRDAGAFGGRHGIPDSLSAVASDSAARLGEQGHEHVREHFLITGN